jgi:autophagy-related protein 9
MRVDPEWYRTVAARIMRKENYLIALVRERVIRIRYCHYNLPFSQSLYWILHGVLGGPIHSITSAKIKRRSIFIGILVLVFIPFAFMFLITFFLIKHAEEFHVHKDYLGPRTWTLYAKTLFRKYNELHHEFEERMTGSYRPAAAFIQQFHDPVKQSVAQFLSFIFSAILTFLAIIAMFDETIMLHVTIGSRNLLFYLAIFSFGMATLHVFIPEPTELPFNPSQKMQVLQRFIQYNPPEWEGAAHTLKVRDEILDLFRHRIRHFFDEIVAALLLPLILIFHIPSRADSIARFLRTNTRRDHVVGETLTSSIEWGQVSGVV